LYTVFTGNDKRSLWFFFFFFNDFFYGLFYILGGLHCCTTSSLEFFLLAIWMGGDLNWGGALMTFDVSVLGRLVRYRSVILKQLCM
jgi:hypothetical protein